MTAKRRRFGLTLLEVIIAIAVLAIGILAAFAMQASSLQGTRTATVVQELSNIALSEIELQRAFVREVTSVSSGLTCRTAFEQPTYTCSVTVRPCSFAAGSVSCGATTVTNPVARQIEVTVMDPQNRQVQISTVSR